MSRAGTTLVDDALLARWPLPAVDAAGDKEGRGRVLIVAGSREIAGAAVLAGEAALRAGAGKLVVATTAPAWALVAAALPEARVISLPEADDAGPATEALGQLAPVAAGVAAVLIGPGMMGAASTVALTRGLLAACREQAFVLDALAMDALMGPGRPAQHPQVVLTPHAGEMAHLTGRGKEEVVARSGALAGEYAAAWQAVVALKGAVTCITRPDGQAWCHEACTPGLATSGSGDVLAGLVAGLLARGADAAQATVWGVALHARAGEQLARRSGMVGYLARELAPEVPALLDALAAPGQD